MSEIASCPPRSFGQRVPFALPIKGGISERTQIFIQGTVADEAQWFAISLQGSESLDEPRPDTSLHFSMRLNENVALRNSYKSGYWGKEERDGGMPVFRGQDFEVIINVTDSCYKIFVNGSHFANFSYRMAKEVGSILRVQGDVYIKDVQFEEVTRAPLFNPQIPVVPFYKSIGSLTPGRSLTIRGVPNDGATRFTVNFQRGLRDDADIAFHFDVRFLYGSDQNVVVRNHRQMGSWGSEERNGHFPFVRNEQFELTIQTGPQYFTVTVNNDRFINFTHRIWPLRVVDSVSITGDVNLSMVLAM